MPAEVDPLLNLIWLAGWTVVAMVGLVIAFWVALGVWFFVTAVWERWRSRKSPPPDSDNWRY